MLHVSFISGTYNELCSVLTNKKMPMACILSRLFPSLVGRPLGGAKNETYPFFSNIITLGGGRDSNWFSDERLPMETRYTDRSPHRRPRKKSHERRMRNVTSVPRDFAKLLDRNQKRPAGYNRHDRRNDLYCKKAIVRTRNDNRELNISPSGQINSFTAKVHR